MRFFQKFKRQHCTSIWWYFILIVFSVLLATGLFVTVFSLLTYEKTATLPAKNKLFYTLIAFFLLSIIIGTVITLFVTKKILNPIRQFTKAANEVAKGNFEVKLVGSNKISEIDELTASFNTMITELKSIETLRTDFVVNVSHEFKTPIASIEGYATLLQDTTLTQEERDNYTKMIIESTKQLSTLTGNILRISKLENQEFIADKTDYRLDEQIRQAILMLEPEWSRKNLELDIELSSVMFNGNKELMMQIWINLLSNAIKFSNDGGRLEVALIDANAFVQIMIYDNGIGMDENTKKHIFEKFYQGDKARSRAGNGLGLPLVKRIIDLCRGDITVNSSVGNGSTFTVRLPKTV